MADAVAVLLSFPRNTTHKASAKAYDQQVTAYLQELGRLPTTVWTKPVDKQNVLDLLDPAVNTIPYIFALNHQLVAAGKDQIRIDDLLARSLVFFVTFDAVQARYASEPFGSVLNWLFGMLGRSRATDLTPLSTAMLRLDPSGGTFTPNHLLFVRMCLDAGVPSQALPILDRNIYAFPQNPTKNIPEDLLSEEHELSNTYITPKSGFYKDKLMPEYILEYYLLGAHIYIGLRNYKRARLFLEYVILTPTQQHVASAFQVEAYKKWVMVGLLAEGRLFSGPRTSDQATMKSIKSMAKPYEALAEDFERRDWKKYQAEMDAGTQIWYEDGNLRLVREASSALLKYRVADLQKTYAALPVSRVASHMDFSADQTLQMLTEMIRLGDLHASISPASSGAADAVLRFHFAPAATAAPGAQDLDLQAQTQRIEELVKFVRDADRRLQLTKEYVDHQKRAKRAASGPDGDLADQMDLTWDAPDAPAAPLVEDGDGDEEDIMAA